MKKCKHCQASFEAKRKDKVYCSKLCRNYFWNIENHEAAKVAYKNWYTKNKESIKVKSRENYKNNTELRKAQIKARVKIRKKTDIGFRLTLNLRKRLKIAINNGQKSGSIIGNLGCSIEELKTYLESKFQPGMSWKNYGFRGWHIDHIVSLSSFDLTNLEQLKKACHYSNLQPLWWKDNLAKGKRNE